jgi:type IV pilus assembly protein PilB
MLDNLCNYVYAEILIKTLLNSTYGGIYAKTRNYFMLNQFNKKQKFPQIPPGTIERAIDEKELLALLPWEIAKEFNAFVFEKKGKAVKIAAVEPENTALQAYIRERFGENTELFLAEMNDVQNVLKHQARDFQSELSHLTQFDPGANGNIVEFVDGLIKYAFAEKASDVHIEPSRAETAIRFRMDGALHTVLTVPRPMHGPLVARFKVLANLKIDEYRRPQDGRIEPEEFPTASLRISTVPTLFGEKITFRILDDSNKNISMHGLGLSPEHEEILMENIEKPYGMIVTAGPTGSGKTTTLYALMQLLKKDGINISTLEDPVEFAVPHINQIQINPRMDLTFASGLRALLRQDPDVIMVGEVRDSETAIMAANAAMTGHLVFTTMHTNDASAAFTRFLEMKVEDFVVASTVNLVIAQRLVRKVCDACAEEQKIEDATIRKIKERKDILEQLEKHKKGMAQSLNTRTFRMAKGCPACFQTGYMGRIGIFELLRPNKEINDLILQHASSEKIKKAGEQAGAKDMIADGIDKVFEGVTTFEEVLRTTKTW